MSPPAWLPPSYHPLPRSFYRRDSREVAPELLNKILVRADGRAGRIVETEAYCGSLDAAAHSYRGKTTRNASMFADPGTMYVYFTYGMHWCANAVCGEHGEGVAVLLRALQPLTGLPLMRLARSKARSDRDLCRGPARLCQAFSIDRAFDGTDLVSGKDGLMMVDDGMAPPEAPLVGPRIGISQATEFPWRWRLADSRWTSGR
ncbi:MAG: DNA-3-methyladenine glycosylase [Dokdonella sp.]